MKDGTERWREVEQIEPRDPNTTLLWLKNMRWGEPTKNHYVEVNPNELFLNALENALSEDALEGLKSQLDNLHKDFTAEGNLNEAGEATAIAMEYLCQTLGIEGYEFT
jgi:hypothetical protein